MIAGFDIGGSFIKGVLADRNAKILNSKSVPTPGTAREIEEAVYGLIEVLATGSSISKIDISCIGVGCAGTLDRAKKKILMSPNIPCLKNYNLAVGLEKRTGLKVFLENDATVALVGSWWKGNGNRYKNWVLVNIGTGVGGGAIIDNKIYGGSAGNAFEIGHMSIDFNGRDCGCGNKGCLERYVSGSALVQFVIDGLNDKKDSSISARMETEPLTAKLIYEEALKKDSLAIAAFDDFAMHLGYGIVNIVNLFSPEAVIIGGGLSAAHKLFIPGAKKILKERALPGMKENIDIVPMKDPDTIPSLGAVRIVLDSCQQG
jgi:glucokinase